MKNFFLLQILALLIFVMPFAAGAQAPERAGKNDFLLERPPTPQDEYEKKVLGILAEIQKNPEYLSVPEHDGRMLRILAETSGAKNIVEIGTSAGYSGIWFGLALRKTGGWLTTFEIDPQRAALARENFKRADMDHIITIVEGDAHETIAQLKDPIDILFLDADKKGYRDYFEKLLPLVRPGGLVIGDNVMLNMTDPAFLEVINNNPGLDTVVRGGVSFTLKKN